MNQLQEIIVKLTRRGIQPRAVSSMNMEFDKGRPDYELMYDLDFGTKSHGYLFGVTLVEGNCPPTETLWVLGRYGELDNVQDLQDLVDIFVDRYGARDYGSASWMELAVEHGRMKVETKKVYTVA